jgi:hypothetical protein
MAVRKNLKLLSNTELENMQIAWAHGCARVRAVYQALRIECCIAQPTPHERQRALAALAWGLRAH